ncbi:hypothetical protein D9615_009998 [Tricholomella constricta]|uniref:Uncharacterized protein n=1 Tax=Tricholomella constricta TaxID=117010 RepID=A0A8H5GU27_9AGAR|nr:hypothetical protein D9615_009998 [Tricholomella constricta]
MEPLPILLGLFFGSVGYGINLITFFACILALVVADGQFKSRRQINYPMTAAACTMISIATGDIVVEVCQNISVFVHKDSVADQRIGGTSRWWTLPLFGLFVAQMTVGDAILIYRCFVVWSRRWRVVLFPILLTLTAIACGLTTIIVSSTTLVPHNRAMVGTLVTTVLSLSLASNFISSSLIVFRIWTIQKESMRYKIKSQDDPLRRAIRVTVEAGLLYTASMFVLLGIHITSGQAQYSVMRSGITFNMVISRTARQQADSQILSSLMTAPAHPMVINTEVVVLRDPPEESLNTPTTSLTSEHHGIKQELRDSWQDQSDSVND